jgi:hypothetical protein
VEPSRDVITRVSALSSVLAPSPAGVTQSASDSTTAFRVVFRL